ncbi:unnamed protein product [Mytilus coruscus]|uniref:Reverse transcriptase domain-containing protein n=1 Tax=Mytilus coruscus TaxID=42192 RepID=A0A6J8ANW3_MYTCO|nr:unnamed protein product [Mytilus coruscus]
MHTLEICSESDDDELFVATIDNSELNTDEWTETINVNDVPINFQLDTGAKCNILSLHKLKTICSHPIITKQVSPSAHTQDTSLTPLDKLDATSGFWHIQLDKPSSKLCTFNTPFGRYRFARLPFGINSASEVFQKIVSEMVSDIDGAEAIINDILILGSDQKEHDMRLIQVLDRACEYNLKLSAGKCEISKPEVTYIGHRLTSEGVKPDPEKICAVNKMSKPECIKDLQTFMETSSVCLRALTQTQQRYPQIEKETLAIVYGCNKFHEYVYGRRVQIETDHKPLQSIFLKPLHQTPPRLQRLLIALEQYDLKVDYRPGKEMYLADHLSRSFLKETKEVLVPDLRE